jgi:hypothetical protein
MRPGTPPPPPEVSIVMPTNGATVQPGFSVFATAIDPSDVYRLELRINGWLWTEIPGVPDKTSPYVIDLPSEVPDGRMDLEVSACNDLDVCGTQQITVTRGAPCTSADACLAGQSCDATGRCAWAPPTGAIGDACTYPQACLSGVCADVGGGELACTDSCTGGANDFCPDNFRCSGAAGQGGVCVRDAVEPEGCPCAAAPGARRRFPTLALFLGLVVGAVLLRRRRAPHPGGTGLSGRGIGRPALGSPGNVAQADDPGAE